MNNKQGNPSQPKRSKGAKGSKESLEPTESSKPVAGKGGANDLANDAGESPQPAAAGDPAPVARPGERARDEQRAGMGPRYGGEPWHVADARGERRFGVARNDDADPSELAPGQADNDDDESPSAADPELAAAEAAGEIESSGQRAGMGRGEHPRKPKSES